MPGPSDLSGDGWPAPVLDRAGQQSFWDRQAVNYDRADMTRDNEGELALVRALCQQFCLSGYEAEDVVTLGGAVGSRDPKVVLDVLGQHGNMPEHIYFNDLSVEMAQQAQRMNLGANRAGSIEVNTLVGPIHEICEHIPVKPRRVIIGVYRAESLVQAVPHYGYPLTGLEEYERNAQIVGARLIIEPVRLESAVYIHMQIRILHSSDYAEEIRLQCRRQIESCARLPSLHAIRVVDQHADQEGFFLSHWFSEVGIRALVGASFSSDRLGTLSLVPCAKGYVLCIDPVEPPRGIVTVLNNVIGNVLPGEQVATLRSIDRISR